VERLFTLPSAVERDHGIDAWFSMRDHELRRMARPWFERMRDCGTDVRELLHDGRPTACVADAPFGYVDAFSAHVNIGFFYGAELDDPARLLEGAGKRMRHAKIRWGQRVDEASLGNLIVAAYRDILSRLKSAE
jgi:hypothetical protein